MSSSKFVKDMLGSNRHAVQETDYLSKNELPEESIARILLTGILKNQFYRSKDDMAKEALPLFKEYAKKNPEYLLKGACLARNSHMKGMVKTALAAIAGGADEVFLNRDITRSTAIALLSTFHPGQLIQFVELCKSKQFGRGFGSRPQKWVRAVMESWNYNKIEIYTLKYSSSLNQLVRLVHPRYVDNRKDVIKYILDGKKEEAKGPKQLVVEELKKISNNYSTIATEMIDHEIPWDVIKGFAGLNGDIAISAMTQMGLTALLLNLRSLEEHNVFNNSGGLTALKLKLKEVINGRSIPLDFAKPYIHCKNSRVKNILLDAMVDVLNFDMGVVESLRVGLSIDISGSMTGETLTTAGLLSVPFLKAENLWFTTFDTNLYQEGDNTTVKTIWGNYYGKCPVIQGLDRKNQIKNLLSLESAGGTNVSVSIEHAIRMKKELDLMVLVTDEQQNSGTKLMTAWNRYKQLINKNAQLWIVNATNYNWHSANFEDKSVTIYQTITPALFKNLDYVGQDIVKTINNFNLKKFISNNIK